jgi:hypothetical protein
MGRMLGWLAGAAGLAGLIKALKQRPAPLPELPAAGPDPRADELRKRLEESKTLIGEPSEAEAADVPVDEAVAPQDKRRQVHERARAAVDRMRASGAPEEQRDAGGEPPRDA